MMLHRALKAGKSDLIRIVIEEKVFITSDTLSLQNGLSMRYREKWLIDLRILLLYLCKL